MPYKWEYRGHHLWRRTGRGGGKYYALWKNGRGKLQKRSLDTPDTTAAKDRLVDVALRNGCLEAEIADRLTVRELVQRHYESYGRNLASSEQAYAHTRILIARLGHLPLDQLSRREQERFVAGMREEGYSATYTADVLSTLRRAVNRAVELEELAAPIRVIAVKRTRERVAPILSVRELAALWAAAEGSFHASMYTVLALGTAGRPPRPRLGDWRERVAPARWRLDPEGVGDDGSPSSAAGPCAALQRAGPVAISGVHGRAVHPPPVG